MEPGSLRWLRFQISPPWCEEDQENQNTVYAGTRASCLVRLRELATLSGACTRGDCRAVAGDLRVFIEGRWTDMARVERLLLNSGVLRDDVTGIDVDGG